MFQENKNAGLPPVSIDELNDLFQDESTIPKTSFMKFTNIGDSIQGVLVEEPQYDAPSKFGKQNIYTLQTTEGDRDIVLVGFNPVTNVRLCRQLKQAEVGDIIAIKFISTYDSGKGNPGKNYDIRIKHVEGGIAKTSQASTAQSTITPEMKLAIIINIAKVKLGATTDEDAKLKAMEVTGIPCLPAKYDQILEVLEGMAKI